MCKSSLVRCLPGSARLIDCGLQKSLIVPCWQAAIIHLETSAATSLVTQIDRWWEADSIPEQPRELDPFRAAKENCTFQSKQGGCCFQSRQGEICFQNSLFYTESYNLETLRHSVSALQVHCSHLADQTLFTLPSSSSSPSPPCPSVLAGRRSPCPQYRQVMWGCWILKSWDSAALSEAWKDVASKADIESGASKIGRQWTDFRVAMEKAAYG